MSVTMPTGVYGEPLAWVWDTVPGREWLDAVGLTAQPVTDAAGVEWLRYIRNTCRAGFSHDTSTITAPQQAAWWAANRARLVARLYANAGGAIVGYGLLRCDSEGKWWSSVAILPEHAGRGYGKAATAHVIRQSPTGVVYAQARRDNPAADKLHDRRDWIVVEEDERLFHYKTREPLP